MLLDKVTYSRIANLTFLRSNISIPGNLLAKGQLLISIDKSHKYVKFGSSRKSISALLLYFPQAMHEIFTLLNHMISLSLVSFMFSFICVPCVAYPWTFCLHPCFIDNLCAKEIVLLQALCVGSTSYVPSMYAILN